MPIVKKYMLFILLLANMTSEYKLLASVSEVFFYSILTVSIIVILLNFQGFSSSLKRVPEIKGLMLIYLIAQFIFQIDLISADNLLYTAAKVFVFGIITLSAYANYNYYLNKLPIVFSYIIVILIVVGWFVNRTDSYGGLVFGFDNRNVACTVATASFAGFLFMRDKLRLLDYACMALLFITILYGGSRNALAMCILIILVRYGFSFRIIAVGALFLALVTLVLPEVGIEVTAYDRLVGTFDGSVAIDREIERETALKMIALRPLTGWGYYYSIPSSVGISMNAHNGYLTMIENLGYPCGLAALAFIVIGSIKRLKLYRLNNNAVNYYLAIVVSTLFAANQEDYFIGVNQFTTNYFFVAFIMLSMYKYYKNNNPKTIG